MSKPNIIFYFSDQQRADSAGCYGQKLPVTPNLDKIADEGTLFKNAFSCQPVCGPMRACLQSGVYATQNGCYRNNIALPTDTKGIAHYLSEAGYDTAYIGILHLIRKTALQQNRLPEKEEAVMITGGHPTFLNSPLTDITATFSMKTITNSNSRVTEQTKSTTMQSNT